MNVTILTGRLTKDPDVRNSNGTAVARYTLAVDREYKKDETDFITCVAFGKGAEFAEKYLRKGTKIAVSGRIQTGSYTNKDGQKVYTTDVVIDRQEFCERKQDQPQESKPVDDAGFMTIPDGIDEELPFA